MVHGFVKKLMYCLVTVHAHLHVLMVSVYFDAMHTLEHVMLVAVMVNKETQLSLREWTQGLLE